MKDMPDHREAELARCNAALLAAHAHLCQNIAVRLADRLAPHRLVQLYSRRYSLAPLDEAWVRIHTIAQFGRDRAYETAAAPNTSASDGAWEVVRSTVRNRIAPFRDADLQERLAYEFAEADATLIKVHVRNALSYAHVMAPRQSRVAAVMDYLARIDVPPGLAGAVHSFALTRLAHGRAIPRLTSARGRPIAGMSGPETDRIAKNPVRSDSEADTGLHCE
jgi:hypothetical protein